MCAARGVRVAGGAAGSSDPKRSIKKKKIELVLCKTLASKQSMLED